jgi:hypothetical protein
MHDDRFEPVEGEGEGGGMRSDRADDQQDERQK